MAYMQADTLPKVGYRPYARTNPRAAATLSGVGQVRAFDPWRLGQSRPFDPWRLGQLNPFHERSWALHGLGAASAALNAALDELENNGVLSPDETAAVRRGDATISDYTGTPDPSDRSSWFSLADLFRETNHALEDLELAHHNAATGNGTHAPYPDAQLAALGQELVQRRQQYSDLASKFAYYYTAVMGSSPPGLSGLGFAAIYWIAGSAIFLVGTVLALYAMRNWAKSYDVQTLHERTAQMRLEAGTSVAASAKEAEKKGDKTTARALRKQAADLFGHDWDSAIEDWKSKIIDNATWIGVAAVGALALGSILGRHR